jgi:hypothetical protein
MEIIISYSNDEEKIADTLIDWVESTFFERCTVIKSPSVDGFSDGALWIKKDYKPAGILPLLINIIGPDSVKNTSSIFQTGCAWGKGIPVISICHSGVSKNTLISPFKHFQAIDAESPNFAKNIIMLIAKLLKVQKIPRIAFSEMTAEMIHVISRISGKTPVNKKKIPEIQSPVTKNIFSEISEELTGIFSQEELKGLDEQLNNSDDNQKRVKYVYDDSPVPEKPKTPKPIEKKIVKASGEVKIPEPGNTLDDTEVKMIIVISDHDRTGCSIYQITSELNMTISEAEKRLKQLETKKFISPTQALFEEPKYYLTKKSIDYIIKNNINLSLS